MLARALLLASALGLLSGCAVEARGGDERRAASPPPAGSGTLEVKNDTAAAIFKVRFSLADDPTWGEDRLGPAEVVMPGERRAWAVPAGAYHLKVELEDGRALDSLDEHRVQAGGSAVWVVRD